MKSETRTQIQSAFFKKVSNIEDAHDIYSSREVVSAIKDMHRVINDIIDEHEEEEEETISPELLKALENDVLNVIENMDEEIVDLSLDESKCIEVSFDTSKPVREVQSLFKGVLEQLQTA